MAAQLATPRFMPDGDLQPSALRPQPLKLWSFSTEELGQVAYADSGHRLEALSSLPSLIRSSRGDIPLETEALRVLLEGVPRADEAAIVHLAAEATPQEPEVRIVQAHQRLATTGPSNLPKGLIYDAVRHKRRSLAQTTPGARPGCLSWVMCVPLPDEPEPGMALVLAGGSEPTSLDPEADLRGDLKFVKLVADTYGSLLLVQDLQRRQAMLSRFFTQPVLAALDGQNAAEVLAPRPTTVTVLFCDLHDSCRLTEQADGELSALCERMMDALSIMTEKIVHEEGVISDFQGDAALGFWGWPFEQTDQVERAARAALAIQKEFQHAAQKPSSPLYRFRCGIGIAHGQAIAGRIGTSDQYKIGVFGPVVNLASRIEALTRRFQVPILLDQAAASRLGAPLLRRWCRLRNLAQVQPHGLTQRFHLHQLLPPRFDPHAMTESVRLDYESALASFAEGDWEAARARLLDLPADGPTQLVCEYIARYGGRPPPDWNGTIVFEKN